MKYLWLWLSFLACQVSAEPLANARNSELLLPAERIVRREIIRDLEANQVIVHDPVIQYFTEQLAKRLVKQTRLTSDPLVFVIQENAINAFAAPTGIMGLNTKTILACQYQGELAAIMAHEVAHLAQGHLYQMFEQNKKVTYRQLLGIVSGILAGAISPDLGLGIFYGSLGASAQSSINFVRYREEEADSVGLDILYDAGFDPGFMPKAFSMICKQALNYEPPVPKWFLTHPVDSERIAYTTNQLSRFPKRQYTENYEYNLIRSRLAFLLQVTLPDNVGIAGEIEQAHLAVLRGLKRKDIKDISVITANLFFLKQQFPDHYIINLLEVEVALLQQNWQLANSLITASLSRNPFNLAILLQYGSLLREFGKIRESIDFLRKGLLQLPDNELLLEALILSYQSIGEKKQAYFTQITRYEIQAEYRKAYLLAGKLLSEEKRLTRVERLRLEAKQQELKVRIQLERELLQ